MQPPSSLKIPVPFPRPPASVSSWRLPVGIGKPADSHPIPDVSQTVGAKPARVREKRQVSAQVPAFVFDARMLSDLMRMQSAQATRQRSHASTASSEASDDDESVSGSDSAGSGSDGGGRSSRSASSSKSSKSHDRKKKGNSKNKRGDSLAWQVEELRTQLAENRLLNRDIQAQLKNAKGKGSKKKSAVSSRSGSESESGKSGSASSGSSRNGSGSASGSSSAGDDESERDTRRTKRRQSNTMPPPPWPWPWCFPPGLNKKEKRSRVQKNSSSHSSHKNSDSGSDADSSSSAAARPLADDAEGSDSVLQREQAVMQALAAVSSQTQELGRYMQTLKQNDEDRAREVAQALGSFRDDISSIAKDAKNANAGSSSVSSALLTPRIAGAMSKFREDIDRISQTRAMPSARGDGRPVKDETASAVQLQVLQKVQEGMAGLGRDISSSIKSLAEHLREKPPSSSAPVVTKRNVLLVSSVRTPPLAVSSVQVSCDSQNGDSSSGRWHTALPDEGCVVFKGWVGLWVPVALHPVCVCVVVNFMGEAPSKCARVLVPARDFQVDEWQRCVHLQMGDLAEAVSVSLSWGGCDADHIMPSVCGDSTPKRSPVVPPAVEVASSVEPIPPSTVEHAQPSGSTRLRDLISQVRELQAAPLPTTSAPKPQHQSSVAPTYPRVLPSPRSSRAAVPPLMLPRTNIPSYTPTPFASQRSGSAIGSASALNSFRESIPSLPLAAALSARQQNSDRNAASPRPSPRYMLPLPNTRADQLNDAAAVVSKLDSARSIPQDSAALPNDDNAAAKSQDDTAGSVVGEDGDYHAEQVETDVLSISDGPSRRPLLKSAADAVLASDRLVKYGREAFDRVQTQQRFVDDAGTFTAADTNFATASLKDNEGQVGDRISAQQLVDNASATAIAGAASLALVSPRAPTVLLGSHADEFEGDSDERLKARALGIRQLALQKIGDLRTRAAVESLKQSGQNNLSRLQVQQQFLDDAEDAAVGPDGRPRSRLSAAGKAVMGANALQQAGEQNLGRQQVQQQFLDDAEDAAVVGVGIGKRPVSRGKAALRAVIGASALQNGAQASLDLSSRHSQFLDDAEMLAEWSGPHPVTPGSTHSAIMSIGNHISHKADDWLSSNLYPHSRQASVMSSVVPSLHPHQRPTLQASVMAARQVAEQMPLVTNQTSIAAAIKALQL